MAEKRVTVCEHNDKGRASREYDRGADTQCRRAAPGNTLLFAMRKDDELYSLDDLATPLAGEDTTLAECEVGDLVFVAAKGAWPLCEIISFDGGDDAP